MQTNTTAAGDQSIEAEIQAKGLTAPRITPTTIQGVIQDAIYFTGEQGYQAAMRAQEPDSGVEHPYAALGTLTICVLVLVNGFIVVGESRPVSPENFDADIGRTAARSNAEAKIWPLLGFQLSSELTGFTLHEGA